MKKLLFSPIFLALLLISSLTSCSNEATMYSGNEYAMFADSVLYMPVTPDSEHFFEVPVSLTKPLNEDKSFGVEVIIKKSNAIEGIHYQILTPNITIKAGQTTASIKLSGIYDNIIYGEKLQISLKLLTSKDNVWDLYGQEARVMLIKCPDFDIHKFEGNIRFFGAFPFSDNMITFLCTTEVLNQNTLVLKGAFSDKYDLRLRLHPNTENPFEDGVEVKDQVVLVDPTYGQVWARTVDMSPSYYNTEARSIFLYMELYVPKVGSFGVHPYIIRWITQAEADAENNSTGTPMSLQPKYLINAFKAN